MVTQYKKKQGKRKSADTKRRKELSNSRSGNAEEGAGRRPLPEREVRRRGLHTGGKRTEERVRLRGEKAGSSHGFEVCRESCEGGRVPRALMTYNVLESEEKGRTGGRKARVREGQKNGNLKK